ncbi:MAG: hypothetical protein DBX01_03915 [Puniceicoccaceae bacterium]|nr:MAG: hypothetical protein DBX01_03915 [Puniceicoccaceae bacterium]
MKNEIAIASAFFASSCFSFAEIVLTESLSVEGFADMSYSRTEDDSAAADQTENSHSLDQVEITFLLDFDAVTAQIDLQWEDGTGYSVDQAFTSYSPSNGIVITVGRYDSMLGFEASEPTGLFQYSGAYSSDTEIFIDNDVSYSEIITPETNSGLKVSYETDTDFFAISLQDGAFFGDGRLGSDTESDALVNLVAQLTGSVAPELSAYAVEAAYAKDLGNGFNAFVGAVFETTEVGSGANDFEIESAAINAFTSYEIGAWLFVGEYTMTVHDVSTVGELEIDSFLMMANCSYSDRASITGRVSHVDADDILEATKFTLAHNYAFTNNLLLVAEISAVDYEFEGGADGETLEGALELLFTF